MRRLTIAAFILVLIAIAGGSAWYLVHTRNAMRGAAPIATTTPEVSEGTAIYSNGAYGFTLFYPESAEVNYGFEPGGYHLAAAWRANALPDAAGNPIVEIVPYEVTNERTYPRHFTALVRVGASTDPKELAACERATEDQGETQLPDAIINGITWKAFSFQNAGMMQYVSGISYRTVHEGACIALERIRVGSSYREEPSAQDIPDATLEAQYDALGRIVESFVFADR